MITIPNKRSAEWRQMLESLREKGLSDVDVLTEVAKGVSDDPEEAIRLAALFYACWKDGWTAGWTFERQSLP